jgi:oxygen-dependent protoporphyrinogen oxidase
MRRVAVVGGGITGLTAAHLLSKLGHRPIVLEASPRVGGKIRTESFHGVDVEAGADAFLPRDSFPMEVVREVGLGGSLVEPAVFGAYVWSGGVLRRLPPGFAYGLPRSPVAAWRAGLLSVPGTLRALSEPVVGRTLTGPDVSIGSFVRSRFGSEVLERLVDPLLAGTRAGDPDRISLAAGAKEIDALARSTKSVLRALRRSGADVGAGSTAFVSVAGGLERLCSALGAQIDDLRLATPVERIERTPGGYRVHGGGSALDTERVIVTVPGREATRLLQDVSDEAAAKLASLRYVSSALIALAYPEGSFDPPADGSGALVPSREGMLVTGITWYSHKWRAARPPDGALILRCFVGRVGDGSALGSSDEDLVGRVVADVHTILGIDAAPIDRTVFRWSEALPVYEVGHGERIARIRAALPPGLAVAGAAYDGTGIPDCMRSAAAAATLVSGS